jgi:hypothetical protein
LIVTLDGLDGEVEALDLLHCVINVDLDGADHLLLEEENLASYISTVSDLRISYRALDSADKFSMISLWQHDVKQVACW